MLGVFLASVEGQEATLVQRARDRAVASAQQVVTHGLYTVLEAKPPSLSPIETLVIAREKRTDYGEF